MMRLKATHNGQVVSETQFIKGPVYIGRHPQSQVFLSHRSVSRQHAVLFLNECGQWMVRDLKSANKTLLNGKPIAEAPLKAGHTLKIGEFVSFSGVGKLLSRPVVMQTCCNMPT